MGPYTHYYLAVKLEPALITAAPGEYAWGAVVPDVRYLAGMQRSHTHVSSAQIAEWQARYPHLDSFVRGYQVHCLLDQIDLTLSIGQTFPIKLLGQLRGRPFSQQQLTVLLELYLLSFPRLGKPVSGAYNAILAELKVDPGCVRRFHAAMLDYFASSSLADVLRIYSRLGMVDDARLERYSRAAKSMQNGVTKRALFWGVRRSGIVEKATRYLEKILL